MSQEFLQVKLTKNLRRTLLRGHPWVYQDALDTRSFSSSIKASLCQVLDPKNVFIGWALYDPHSVIRLRILNLTKEIPHQKFFQEKVDRIYKFKRSLLPKFTNCFRWINGEGDGFPGLICDLYDKVALLQFDGEGPKNFWQNFDLSSFFINECQTIFIKERNGGELLLLKGDTNQRYITVYENDLIFKIDLLKGQKTGFFLDQRDNRQYLKSLAHQQRVLNLFSYTGGFSIYAGKGGAKQVTSVDISEIALELAHQNWELNNLNPNIHETICSEVDLFLENNKNEWDIVICDPPSMAYAEKQKERAINKYIQLFSNAAKKTIQEGHLILSSCSSHISFDDFFEIINESLSLARSRGKIYFVGGQGIDHPWPHICPELRYLKFVHLQIFK